MAQDLRDLFREERKKVQRPDMLKGHAQRFENLLEQRLPKEEKPAKQHKFFFMKIAAVLVVAVSIGWFLYQSGRSSVENAVVNTQQSTENQVEKETNRYLSDISPDYIYSFDLVGNGTIYGLDGVYYSPETIEPGRGYWVRANEEGEITLIPGSTAKQISITNALQNANSLELSNGNYMLYQN